MPGFATPVKAAAGAALHARLRLCIAGAKTRDVILNRPIPEVEAKLPVSQDRSLRRTRGSAGRWLRRAVIAAAVVAALPFALTLVYAVPGVRPVSLLMVGDLLTLRGYDRQWVPLDDMGSALPHSVMMSEDGQFCSHFGIDLGELNAVLEDAIAGEPSRGASTIPMQTVKNLYLWHGRSYIRKVLELPLAVYFDAVLPKRRIMEIYLNIAEWGPNIYGAEAAARHHFGRSARDLTARQAALLAVTLPSPATRNPAAPGPAMQRTAAVVQRRAAQAGDYVGCLD
jgi:monofunctional biosynthetic peptidoglycan transglycosylase